MARSVIGPTTEHPLDTYETAPAGKLSEASCSGFCELRIPRGWKEAGSNGVPPGSGRGRDRLEQPLHDGRERVDVSLI
jgi:hypothetical protein